MKNRHFLKYPFFSRKYPIENFEHSKIDPDSP